VDPNAFDRLYTYAWFVTFALSFIIYWLLMRKDPGAHAPVSNI
jgi:cytosine/uracil/thiamine/allantoin permease